MNYKFYWKDNNDKKIWKLIHKDKVVALIIINNMTLDGKVCSSNMVATVYSKDSMEYKRIQSEEKDIDIFKLKSLILAKELGWDIGSEVFHFNNV